MTERNTLTIQELSVSYHGKTALDDLSSVNISSGKITGIIGPNGAGKSTFLKGILGLIKTEKRSVLFNEQDIDQQKKKIAYVEQRSALDLTFPINVLDVVLLGTYPTLGLFKQPGKKEKVKALQALKAVQLEDFSNRQIGELSGGQLQRVFIARVLIQQAEIIFLDEPFVGIDMTSEKVIMDMLKQLKNQGKIILIVHHDLHKVTHYFEDIIILNKQLIASGSVIENFTSKMIQKAYGDMIGDIFNQSEVPK